VADLIITGVHPYDGRYPLDTEREFSTREWGWIKRFAGYLPLTLDDKARADPELGCVLAVIALHRAGKIDQAEAHNVFERLIDKTFGTDILVEGDDAEQEGDAGPPVSRSNGSSATSGEGSPTNSERSAETPNPSGIPGSASSLSGRPTLVT